MGAHRTFHLDAVEIAVVAVVGAYLVGHALQGYATRWLPSRFRIGDRLDAPSQYLLDDPHQISGPLRARIAVLARERFGLDIERLEERRDAFFLLRSTLLLEGKALYPEQFQGLYALARGGMIGLAVGGAWLLGWSLLPALVVEVSGALLVTGLASSLGDGIRKPLERRSQSRWAQRALLALALLPALVASAGAGGLAGHHFHVAPYSSLGLLAVPLALSPPSH